MKSTPSGVSGGRIRIPLWSSPMPSSSTAQIMPSEIRPYFFAAVISKPPGKIAPTVANATRSPAVKLVAPQITPVTVAGSAVSSASLTATRQYLIGFLNSVSSSIVSTWATITPRISWPTCSTASTSRPAAVSRRPTSCASTGAGIGAYSRSQEMGTRIAVRSPSRMPG